jgi:hypothetical protein
MHHIWIDYKREIDAPTPDWAEFPVRNTKWLKNGKLRKAILSAFYNISQRNFGILLILWCSFKLWWNFCLDQNFCYKGKVHWPGKFDQGKMKFVPIDNSSYRLIFYL